MNAASTIVFSLFFASTGLAEAHTQGDNIEEAGDVSDVTKADDETEEYDEAETPEEVDLAEEDENDETRKAMAKREFAQGQEFFLREEYKKAVASFNKAYKHWPYRVIHYNLALAYTFMKDDENAYRHLLVYLRDATESERDLPKELRSLQGRMGMMIIRVDNPRAEIHVDGNLVGSGRSEHIVQSGTREVVIKVDGREVAQNTIEVIGGGVQTWDLVLPESPPPSRRTFGKLHWGFFAAGGGATLVSLVASTALSVRTKKLRDEFMNDRSDADLRARGIRTKRSAEVMWAVTGLLAVGTAVTAFFTRWREEERTLIIAAVPGERGAMLSITWNR